MGCLDVEGLQLPLSELSSWSLSWFVPLQWLPLPQRTPGWVYGDAMGSSCTPLMKVLGWGN